MMERNVSALTRRQVRRDGPEAKVPRDATRRQDFYAPSHRHADARLTPRDVAWTSPQSPPPPVRSSSAGRYPSPSPRTPSTRSPRLRRAGTQGSVPRGVFHREHAGPGPAAGPALRLPGPHHRHGARGVALQRGVRAPQCPVVGDARGPRLRPQATARGRPGRRQASAFHNVGASCAPNDHADASRGRPSHPRGARAPLTTHRCLRKRSSPCGAPRAAAPRPIAARSPRQVRNGTGAPGLLEAHLSALVHSACTIRRPPSGVTHTTWRSP
jgi:hypothetical protein